MHRLILSNVSLLGVLLCALVNVTPSLAQEWPTKPIRFIVPLTPGSGADIAGRILGKHLSESLRQPVIVENRPGAGGIIGTQAVVKADPDGYTLLVQSSSHSANPAIYKALPYDPLKDTVDVALLGMTPYVMVTASTSPYKNLKSLLDAARAKPGDLPFASAGIGSSTHLAAEYVVDLANAKMLHIPFKGSPDAIQDVIGARSTFYMAPINAAVNLIKDGKLAALGVSTRTRAEVLPNVPTIAEQGLPEYNMTLWFGMWAPAGTPNAVVQKLNTAISSVLAKPAIKQKLSGLGADVVSLGPNEYRTWLTQDHDRWAQLIKQANIKDE